MIIKRTQQAGHCPKYLLIQITLSPKRKWNFRISWKNLLMSSIAIYGDIMDQSLILRLPLTWGPTQLPRHRGHLTQHSNTKFYESEEVGVFTQPETLGVSVEYINPSFLINTFNSGHWLVTAFSKFVQYSKLDHPLYQTDSTLRKISQWHFIRKSDLTKAFCQKPLGKESMKYCGVVISFRSMWVYTRCTMGMPKTETVPEELMCGLLGNLLFGGHVRKFADELYCGGNTTEDLHSIWRGILLALSKTNLRLSASKTVIHPRQKHQSLARFGPTVFWQPVPIKLQHSALAKDPKLSGVYAWLLAHTRF